MGFLYDVRLAMNEKETDSLEKIRKKIIEIIEDLWELDSLLFLHDYEFDSNSTSI